MPVALPPPSAIQIAVSNVRNDRGHVRVELCTEKQFMKDCTFSGEAPAHVGTVIVTIRDVPAGRYAAQVSHDENDNHQVDRGWFGIPKEGVGFSNNAKIRMGPPRFAEAAFDHGGMPQRIALGLIYMMR
jgi:uncharacterized protein (DUF2141 family)